MRIKRSLTPQGQALIDKAQGIIEEIRSEHKIELSGISNFIEITKKLTLHGKKNSHMFSINNGRNVIFLTSLPQKENDFEQLVKTLWDALHQLFNTVKGNSLKYVLPTIQLLQPIEQTCKQFLQQINKIKNKRLSLAEKLNIGSILYKNLTAQQFIQEFQNDCVLRCKNENELMQLKRMLVNDNIFSEDDFPEITRKDQPEFKGTSIAPPVDPVNIFLMIRATFDTKNSYWRGKSAGRITLREVLDDASSGYGSTLFCSLHTKGISLKILKGMGVTDFKDVDKAAKEITNWWLENTKLPQKNSHSIQY